ncbi:MAG TPA: hypothetical protein ENN41_07145 [Sediminispirochaeta sp.]|nr:hypothetical protein [Sediminispirochaeta sp.]
MESFDKFVEEKKAELNRSTHFVTDEDIERTARDLENTNYEPPVFIPTTGFLRYRVKDIHREIDRIAALGEEDLKNIRLAQEISTEELKRKNIGILVDQFLLLEKLRAGVPEAWDEIHELYEDD